MDSAEKIEGSLDLLTKILLSLPAKPLFRFKCVSRRWNSLISARQFATRWKPTVSGVFTREPGLDSPDKRMYNYIPIESGDVCWQNSRAPLECIDYTDVKSPIAILDSVGGLLLCCYNSPVGHGRDYLICNHTTKRFTSLPDPDPGAMIIDGDLEIMCLSDSISLAYDLSRSPHYKVITVRQEQVNKEFPLYYHIQVRIYSSETKCWGPWGPEFGTPDEVEFDSGVFLNNAVYWPSSQAKISSLYYDIDGESFHSFPMPPLPSGRTYREIKHFGEANGCLFMIIPITPQTGGYTFEGAWNDTKFDIHELEKDCSSWSIKYRLDLGVIERALGAYKLRLMCALGQEDEEGLLLVLYASNMMIAYKPKEVQYMKLCDLDPAHSAARSNLQSQRKVHYHFVENPFVLP